MNWGALTAFILQLSRIGIGGAGVWMLATGGNQAIGWGLLAASGIAVGIDVAKVSAQIKATAQQAAEKASTTTTIIKQEPAPPANDPPAPEAA